MGYKLEGGACVPCPIGTRAGLWGQGLCIPCPEGMTTFGTASLQCGMFISHITQYSQTILSNLEYEFTI